MAKTLTFALVTLVCLMDPRAWAFVVPLKLEEKCEKADLIARAVVIEVVRLTGDPSERRITGESYHGPHSVALVRVVEVVKAGEGRVNRVVMVPCGYDVDESPGELTKGQEYVLFLERMGRNYFHPLDAFSTHRISRGRVALFGMDADLAFGSEADAEKSDPYEQYRARIKGLLAPRKK